MSMLSAELELSLNEAYEWARKKEHRVMTVEHLLLAVLENPSVAEAVSTSNAKVGSLSRDLASYIEIETPKGFDEDDVLPTRGFQRVLQRAVFAVQRI